jgi:hypothetical protein
MVEGEIAIIRRVRHEISAECGHDIDRLVAHYRRFEEQLKQSGRFRFATRVDRPESGGEPQRPPEAQTAN